MLDVVLVTDEDRAALVAYLDGRVENRPLATPRLPTRRGRKLVLRPPDERTLRVDDEMLAEYPERSGIDTASASVDPARVTVLVPAAL